MILLKIGMYIIITYNTSGRKLRTVYIMYLRGSSYFRGIVVLENNNAFLQNVFRCRICYQFYYNNIREFKFMHNNIYNNWCSFK